MRKTQFFMLFCLHICVIFAQKNMDSIGVKEDFKIFESILKKGHPSLYEYISGDSLENIFETTKESLKTVRSDIELYKKMILVTDKIKDGHLSLSFPNTIKTDQYYFPLILKLINSDFFTDTNDFNIAVGSKINRINKIEVSTILEALKKYIPCDGYNLTRKYREIELKFGLYFAYEYGIQKEFSIDYTDPNGIKKNCIVASESFAKVRLRNTKRNSYFATFHQKESNFDYFDEFINKKDPFVYYKDEINTAVLVVNSFGGDIRIFKSNLIKIFKEINKKKIPHLVIDVRRNEGGFRPNAIYLYSFITATIFRQRTSEFIASLTVPEKKYVTRTYFNEKEFLKDRFYNHPVYDGWKLNFDDMETIMVPDKNRFKGKVYVLTSGSTFSEGSTFVLNAKNNPDITIIGEETGGGYYFHTGEFPVFYELPNSKIIVTMYMDKIDHYVMDNTVPKGSGILPDKHIFLSAEDLISGKDPELDYIFRWIKG